MIDTAEDRNKFSALCDEVGIDQPEWQMLSSTDEALAFCKKVERFDGLTKSDL